VLKEYEKGGDRRHSVQICARSPKGDAGPFIAVTRRAWCLTSVLDDGVREVVRGLAHSVSGGDATLGAMMGEGTMSRSAHTHRQATQATRGRGCAVPSLAPILGVPALRRSLGLLAVALLLGLTLGLPSGVLAQAAPGTHNVGTAADHQHALLFSGRF
jgi:hypothetical protein